MGMISTGAGFAAYYTTFNFFGFAPSGLFDMANIDGYYPQDGDFNLQAYPAGVDPTLANNLFGSMTYFNLNLYNAVTQAGKTTCTGVTLPGSYTINW